MADAELEALLRIDFPAYLGGQVFERDAAESTQASLKLRRAAEVLVLRRRADGLWQYFNPADDRDHGTVVQYLQRRTGMNLGQVRKALRPWLAAGGPPPAAGPRTGAGEGAVPDLAAVRARWGQAPPVRGLPAYLARRGLAAATVARFAATIRADGRGNVLFAHTDAAGDLTGYEIKGEGLSRFSKGGARALARFAPIGAPVRRVAVCESGIKALSWAELSGWHDTLFLSTGGAVAARTLDLVAAALEAEAGAALVLGFNNDPPGARMTRRLQERFPAAAVALPDPAAGKDWNDALRHARARPWQGRLPLP